MRRTDIASDEEDDADEDESEALGGLGSRRRQRGREEALYGIWAADDPDSDSRSSRGYGIGSERRQSKKLNTPMSFVSSGKIGGADEDLDKGKVKENSTTAKTDTNRKVEDVVVEEDVLPTEFGRSIAARIREKANDAREQKQTEDEKKNQRKNKKIRRDMFGGAAGSEKTPAKNVASFESHTKGIGSKLLGMMGWKAGEGLGKEKKGIATPVEAIQRPKGLGMGFGNRQEAGQLEKKRMSDASAIEDDELVVEESLQQKSRRRNWKKREGQAEKRKFKSVDDILQEKSTSVDGVDDAPLITPIIDARGPQIKVINSQDVRGGLVAITSGDSMGNKTHLAQEVNDLLFAVNASASQVETEARNLEKKRRFEEETLASLSVELNRLKMDAEAQAAKQDAFQEIIDLLDKATDPLRPLREYRINALEETFRRFPEEWELFGLQGIAGALAAEDVAHQTGPHWDPLKRADAEAGSRCLQNWLHFFTGDKRSSSQGKEIYAALVELVLIPPLSRQLNTPLSAGGWDPRNPEGLLDCLDYFEDVLAICSELKSYIIGTLLVPRLSREVQEWNPRTENVAINLWVFPWLPFIEGDPITAPRLNEILLTIRIKLTSALANWDVADNSAFELITPWHKVFNTQDWKALVQRAVIPKLAKELGQFEINPANQLGMSTFKAIIRWQPYLQQDTLPRLLEDVFFPKWHKVLMQWLQASSSKAKLGHESLPDTEQISRWYMGWKSNFPEEILSTERIRRQLKIGLDMMNQALTGGTVSLAAAMESAGPPSSNAGGSRNGPDNDDLRSRSGVPANYVNIE